MSPTRPLTMTILIAGLASACGLASCDSDSTDSNWHPSQADASADQDSGNAGGSAGKDAGVDTAGGAGAAAAGGEAGAAGTGQGGAAGGVGGQAGAELGGAGGSEQGGSGQGGSECVGQGGFGPDCSFPQGVPDPDFIESASSYQDTDPAVDAAVNAVMESLSGCGAMTDCDIAGFPGTTAEEICQSWFDAVNSKLREQGFCAGQHVQGATDEIAVNNTCCAGKWYGYHVCNYGGPKVVWAPGARRGWWKIAPSHCP